jgi:indolepyruvate ferredoxin oxidoreductase
VLRSVGRSSKIRVDARLAWGLRVLARMRGLRGTPFDPFGRTHVRRLERHLAKHFRQTVEDLLDRLTTETHGTAVQVAAAAQLVRGYEEVKLAGVERYRARLAELGVRPPVDGDGQLVDA